MTRRGFEIGLAAICVAALACMAGAVDWAGQGPIQRATSDSTICFTDSTPIVSWSMAETSGVAYSVAETIGYRRECADGALVWSTADFSTQRDARWQSSANSERIAMVDSVAGLITAVGGLAVAEILGPIDSLKITGTSANWHWCELKR